MITGIKNISGIRGIGGLGALLNLSSLKTKMAFWSDGTIVGNQLTDLSGNGRSGYVSDNILTDGNAEFGTILSEFGTACVLNENTTSDFYSETRCFHVIGGAANRGGYTPNRWRTQVGEVVNYSFRIKRISNTPINLYVSKGGSGFGVNTAITPTLNTWTLVTGNYTETSGGKNAYLALVQPSTTTVEYYVDDINIWISGKSNIGLTMPNDATLKSIDWNNNFYSSTGIPLTFRTDIGGRGFYNRKIFTKNSLAYIWSKNELSIDDEYLVNLKFSNPDFIFDSCENVATVGAGKTYATVQAAITGIGNARTFDDKFRIDIYDSFISNTPSAYITMQQNIYLNGIIDSLSIHLEPPVTSSDAQVLAAETSVFFNNSGARNIILSAKNARYAEHTDAVGNANSFKFFYKCKFFHYGNQAVIDYRIANSQAYNNIYSGVDAVGMGASNNHTIKFVNCEMGAIKPIFWHSNPDVTTIKEILEIRKCNLVSMPIFNTLFNPNSEIKENIALQKSTAPIDSEVRLIKNIYNSTITFDGTVTQTFPQKIEYEDMSVTIK